MAVNQEYKEYRVNDLPETGYAGDRYYLNVGGGKFQTYIISDALTPVREAGQDFIECDTVDDLRALDARQIWALENGHYKGVQLNGYYEKGDTPAPIQYYLSDTTEVDNGGSVFEVGGVKLEHEFIDAINVLYFGAKGDGVFDNGYIFQRCCDIALQTGLKLYIPTGEYIIDTSLQGGTNHAIMLSNWTAENQGLYMYGDGIGKTIIKEADGATNRGGRYTRMFYCYFGTSPVEFKTGDYIFEDITFDKNARSNENTDTLYFYEQSAIIAFSGNGAKYIPTAKFNNLEFKDKIGACIGMTSSTGARLDNVLISNIISRDHPYVTTRKTPSNRFGQRGDIEVLTGCNNISINNVNVLYSQTEPVVLATKDRPRNYNITNSVIDLFEYTDKSYYSQINISNCTVIEDFLVRDTACNVVNSTLKMLNKCTSRDLNISNSTLLVGYNESTLNIDNPFSFAWVTGTTGINRMKVSNCSIVLDSDNDDLRVTGYLVDGGTGNMTNYEFTRTFINCTFDKRAEFGINAYYNGNWDIINCKCGSTSHFVDVGGFAALPNTYSNLRFIDNNVDDVLGRLIIIKGNNTNFKIYVKGAYSASNTFSKTGSFSADGLVQTEGLIGSAPTNSFIPKNTTVINNDSSVNNIYGWIKTIEGATSTNWTTLYLSKIASTTVKGLVNQSAKVDDVTSPNATDLATAITLINELKSKLNAKLVADRASGQQSTT